MESAYTPQERNSRQLLALRHMAPYKITFGRVVQTNVSVGVFNVLLSGLLLHFPPRYARQSFIQAARSAYRTIYAIQLT
jgi:hypothetical protein